MTAVHNASVYHVNPVSRITGGGRGGGGENFQHF